MVTFSLVVLNAGPAKNICLVAAGAGRELSWLGPRLFFFVGKDGLFGTQINVPASVTEDSGVYPSRAQIVVGDSAALWVGRLLKQKIDGMKFLEHTCASDETLAGIRPKIPRIRYVVCVAARVRRPTVAARKVFENY